MARIVYIEDEEQVRALVAAELREQGFDVAEAGDGAAGLKAILDTKPDLVLCDIAMPGMDGGELLRRLRRDNPELARMPFVFLTALASREQVIAGKELGADDYLTKPIDLGVLVATIHARLDQIARIDDLMSDERAALLDRMSRETELSFLSAADVLNHFTVGVVLLKLDGRVSYINQAARRMIEDEDGLLLHPSGLCGATPRDTAALRAVVAAVAAEGGREDFAAGMNVLTLPRPSLRRPYQVMVSSLRDPGSATARDTTPSREGVEQPSVAVFIHDPDQGQRLSSDALIRLHGLSVAEARVVVGLAGGQSPEEIADALQLSRSTVATHLQRAFGKTQTTSQRELVSLVLQGAPVAQAPSGRKSTL
jgi:DNA-binding NarL/FixJ family response regulator